MKVERDWSGPRLIILGYRILQTERVQLSRELRRRRIGRVPRAGNGIFPDEIQVQRSDARCGKFGGRDHVRGNADILSCRATSGSAAIAGDCAEIAIELTR